MMHKNKQTNRECSDVQLSKLNEVVRNRLNVRFRVLTGSQFLHVGLAHSMVEQQSPHPCGSLMRLTRMASSLFLFGFFFLMTAGCECITVIM